MADCEFYQELISQALDGALDAQAQQALEQHMEQCADCRRLEQQLRQIHSALSALEEQRVPDGFAQGVMARIQALEQPAPANVIPFFRRPQVRALGSIAACAVLCLGLWRMDLTGDAHSAAPAPSVSAEPQAQVKMAQSAASSQAAVSPMMLTETELSAPDEDDLLAQVTQALGAQPGILLVLEEIPAQLNGAWYATADGRTFLLVDTEKPAQLAAQLTADALLCLELGSGPLVLALNT